MEYSLPLAVLGVLMVAGLVSLGPGFQSMLKGSMNGSSAANSAASNGKTINVRPMGSNPFTGTVLLTLSDGSQVEISNYPKDLKHLIETLGPNGATDLMANAISDLAKALLAAGKITPDEANQLSQLANHGHTLAASQFNFEQMVDAAGNDSFLLNQKMLPLLIQKNKESRISKDLDPLAAEFFKIPLTKFEDLKGADGKIVYDSKGEIVPDRSVAVNYALGKESFDFQNAFAQAMKLPLYNEPAVRTVLNALGGNIIKLTDTTHALSARAALPEYGIRPDQVKGKISNEVDSDSAKICNLGGGNDSGVHCP
ncbi:MAG: hypothetical protein K2X66_17430 [Cyanobacteria bacterium]|nr:hypothetical protein [Cyanobacteriota bacterium]